MSRPARPDAAFRRRRRADRVRRARPWLLLAGFAGTAGLVAWVVLASSVLALARVDVEGTSLLSPATVRRAAALPAGEPLARVDLDAARARVEALVEVREVEVRREWPDGVRIAVTEREGVAVVEREGRLQGMDLDGVVFRDYVRRPAGLPVVRVLAGTRTEALAEAAAVLAALPDALREDVAFVTVRTVDDITLALRGGRSVVWGSAEASTSKAEVLAALLARPPQEPAVREYDVSVPGRPTTRS